MVSLSESGGCFAGFISWSCLVQQAQKSEANRKYLITNSNLVIKDLKMEELSKTIAYPEGNKMSSYQKADGR
jgi:hypothetical protein